MGERVGHSRLRNAEDDVSNAFSADTACRADATHAFEYHAPSSGGGLLAAMPNQFARGIVGERRAGAVGQHLGYSTVACLYHYCRWRLATATEHQSALQRRNAVLEPVHAVSDSPPQSRTRRRAAQYCI